MKKLLILFAALSLFSCDKDQEYDKAKAVSAFVDFDPIKIDPALAKVEISLPQQKRSEEWSGSASFQNQQIENFSKNFTLKKAGFFSAQKKISLDISSRFWSFYSGKIDDNFVFSPVIKDGKIFFLNTSGVLIAQDLQTDKKILKARIFAKKILKNYRSPKIFIADQKVFAVAGVNKIAAASEVDGKILWSKEISSIPVSAPVSDGNFVYVSTNDNKLYALSAKDGELQWVQSGIIRPTAIFGAADPVIYKDLIIASYSSGEIYAVNKKTGEPLWSQDLNISKATNSDFYLNDIDATPLVKNGVVYSIGNGGLMMAIDAKTGNYLWKKEIAGIVDFWAAGEFLFVINNDNKLLAIGKKTGGIKWISQLPSFVKEKKPETKIIYCGMVMVGDKLVISRSDGYLLIASPSDGSVEKTLKIGKKISHSPAIVGDKIYLHSIGKYLIDLVEIE